MAAQTARITWSVRIGPNALITLRPMTKSGFASGGSIIALALLALAMVMSGVALMHEIRVDRIGRAARSAILGLNPVGQTEARKTLDRCEKAGDERIVIACLAGISGLMRLATDPATRAADLHRGRRGAAKIGASIPASGETLTAVAVLESSADDSGSERRAIAALIGSYRAAPYLRQATLWRIWYAAHRWDALDLRTQQALLAEAVWFGSLGKPDREAVLSALRDTPALVRVVIRLPGEPGETLPLPSLPE